MDLCNFGFHKWVIWDFTEANTVAVCFRCFETREVKKEYGHEGRHPKRVILFGTGGGNNSKYWGLHLVHRCLTLTGLAMVGVALILFLAWDMLQNWFFGNKYSK
jgi:hypothetical protein